MYTYPNISQDSPHNSLNKSPTKSQEFLLNSQDCEKLQLGKACWLKTTFEKTPSDASQRYRQVRRQYDERHHSGVGSLDAEGSSRYSIC